MDKKIDLFSSKYSLKSTTNFTINLTISISGINIIESSPTHILALFKQGKNQINIITSVGFLKNNSHLGTLHPLLSHLALLYIAWPEPMHFDSWWSFSITYFAHCASVIIFLAGRTFSSPRESGSPTTNENFDSTNTSTILPQFPPSLSALYAGPSSSGHMLSCAASKHSENQSCWDTQPRCCPLISPSRGTSLQ